MMDNKDESTKGITDVNHYDYADIPGGGRGYSYIGVAEPQASPGGLKGIEEDYGQYSEIGQHTGVVGMSNDNNSHAPNDDSANDYSEIGAHDLIGATVHTDSGSIDQETVDDTEDVTLMENDIYGK
jgi:hypothetical protein